MEYNINQIVQGWITKQTLQLLNNTLVKESKFRQHFENPDGYSILTQNGGFAGGRKIKLRNLYISDVSKHDRDGVYKNGSTAFDTEEYQLRWDLSRNYFIDRLDLNDVGVAATEWTSAVYQKFIKEKIVPAVDQIIITEICAKAKMVNSELGNVLTWDSANAQDAFNKWLVATEYARDTFSSNDGEIKVFITSEFLNAIRMDTRFNKSLYVDELVRSVDGETGKVIDTRIIQLDGYRLHILPKDKMITKFIVNPDTETAETVKDKINTPFFIPDANATTAHLLITKFKHSAYINLLDEPKFFDSAVNQAASGYSLAVRVFGDMVITRHEYRNIFLVEKSGIKEHKPIDMEKPQIDDNTTPRDHLNNFDESTLILPNSSKGTETVLDAKLNVAASDAKKAEQLLQKKAHVAEVYAKTIKELESLELTKEEVKEAEQELKSETKVVETKK